MNDRIAALAHLDQACAQAHSNVATIVCSVISALETDSGAKQPELITLYMTERLERKFTGPELAAGFAVALVQLAQAQMRQDEADAMSTGPNPGAVMTTDRMIFRGGGGFPSFRPHPGGPDSGGAP